MGGWGLGGGQGAQNLQHCLDVANEESSIDGVEVSDATPTLDVPRGPRQLSAPVRLLRGLVRRS